jgi:hypothetical protein
MHTLCHPAAQVLVHDKDTQMFRRGLLLQVEDPNLAKHLAYLGINMMVMEKTEKSMAEMNIEVNSS